VSRLLENERKPNERKPKKCVDTAAGVGYISISMQSPCSTGDHIYLSCSSLLDRLLWHC